MQKKRLVELVVISDVHLGTYGCHAKELLQYLRTVKPKTLILNGDIIDIWNFRKRYFPKSHLRVVKRILTMAQKGTKVVYLTGNHDELLRRFGEHKIGNIHIKNKHVMELDGRKAWFFHGDIFDASIQNAKWIAKLGGWGYDLLILLNRAMNWCLERMGREKFSLSKKIKDSVKKAVKYIGDFEKSASDLAIDQKFDFVVCGHIHQPQMREIDNGRGKCMYLNSGDWVENLTALEYQDGQWSLYTHESTEQEEEQPDLFETDPKVLLQILLNESNNLAS